MTRKVARHIYVDADADTAIDQLVEDGYGRNFSDVVRAAILNVAADAGGIHALMKQRDQLKAQLQVIETRIAALAGNHSPEEIEVEYVSHEAMRLKALSLIGRWTGEQVKKARELWGNIVYRAIHEALPYHFPLDDETHDAFIAATEGITVDKEDEWRVERMMELFVDRGVEPTVRACLEALDRIGKVKGWVDEAPTIRRKAEKKRREREEQERSERELQERWLREDRAKAAEIAETNLRAKEIREAREAKEKGEIACRPLRIGDFL